MRHRAVSVIALAAALGLCAPAGAEEPTPIGTEPPMLAWDKMVWCIQTDDGQTLRVQCSSAEDGQPRCLEAPNEDHAGRELERIRPCNRGYEDHYESLIRSGAKRVPAVAEAPPGWHRDGKGRVFQVTFDLRKRFYLGAGWLPAFGLTDPTDPAVELGRARFDLGFEASWLEQGDRDRHTVRAIEGFVAMERLEVAGMLFAYDLSHASARPLLRITTFFGPPARHDMYLDLGWGLNMLDFHIDPHGAELADLSILELHAAWDLWQTADLRSHLRLETGAAVEGQWIGPGHDQSRYAISPGARLKLRLDLDQAGFHHFLAELGWSMPVWVSEAELGQTATRAGVEAAYEWILLAINDQPLSLRFEAACGFRDDLPADSQRWEATALAGLRFSFWVPARLNEQVPQYRIR